MRICSVENCGRKHYIKGYCENSGNLRLDRKYQKYLEYKLYKENKANK